MPMPPAKPQPTLFVRGVFIAATVAAILGLLEIVQGLLSLEFANVGEGVFLMVVSIGAAWLYTRFGVPRR
jgi:hypothetical protein